VSTAHQPSGDPERRPRRSVCVKGPVCVCVCVAVPRHGAAAGSRTWKFSARINNTRGNTRRRAPPEPSSGLYSQHSLHAAPPPLTPNTRNKNRPKKRKQICCSNCCAICNRLGTEEHLARFYIFKMFFFYRGEKKQTKNNRFSHGTTGGI